MAEDQSKATVSEAARLLTRQAQQLRERSPKMAGALFRPEPRIKAFGEKRALPGRRLRIPGEVEDTEAQKEKMRAIFASFGIEDTDARRERPGAVFASFYPPAQERETMSSLPERLKGGKL